MTRLAVAIVVLLALISGAYRFAAVGSKPATLVIQARTFASGAGYVQAVGKEGRGGSRVRFKFADSRGEPMLYTIELQRMDLESVTILPLAEAGRYAVDRIILASDSVRYSWDERLACSREALRDGLLQRESCGTAPLISVERDGSIVIASIPAAGFANTPAARLTITLFSSFAVIFAGLFLLKAGVNRHKPDFPSRLTARMAWLAVIALYGYQLYLLWAYTVDVPYFEEWEFFEPFALPAGFSWEWLTRPVSHQRMMFFTKLMAWVNYKLFNLDFVLLKIQNYLLFGGLLLAISRFKRRLLGDEFTWFPLFMIFLLSPIAYEVHASSFQSGEIFVLLFATIALGAMIGTEASFWGGLLFPLCAVLAMYTLSAGLVLAVVFLLVKVVYALFVTSPDCRERQARLRSAGVAGAVILPSMFIWLYGFKKPGHTPDWLLPMDHRFWEAFLNLLGFCFGFEVESLIPGIICLLLLLTPLFLLLKDEATRWRASTWQILAAIVGMLAVVVLIVIGRGNMIGTIKISRYVIFGFLLIPYGAVAWWLAMKRGLQRTVALVVFWLFCASAYLNDWSYDIYRDLKQQDLMTLECVERYSNGTGDGVCLDTHKKPIGGYFDNAKKLNISFTRRFGSSGAGN